MMSKRLSAVAAVVSCMLALHACGGSSTSPDPTPVPTPAPTPNFPVIIAAGDISCDSANPGSPCKARETSDLVIAERALRSAVLVLPLGDLQYEAGTLAEFNRSYQATWGRFNDIARPVPGNHEYETRGAAGYFTYFSQQRVNVGSSTEGWYEHNVGNWHFVALNSNCAAVGGCGTNSPQYRWLQADLAANRRPCTVAYMHHPFLSSGQNGSTPALGPMMRLLHAANTEIVLSGHDHSYERFAQITPDGVPDPAKGLRFFVVGTGGRDLYNFTRVLPSSEIRYNQNFGVLRIVMKDAAYDWQFVDIAGITRDQGSGVCF